MRLGYAEQERSLAIVNRRVEEGRKSSRAAAGGRGAGERAERRRGGRLAADDSSEGREQGDRGEAARVRRRPDEVVQRRGIDARRRGEGGQDQGVAEGKIESVD